jgi:hypothetical protein
MDYRALLGGAGLGAFLMFILDPDRGGRRRALVRDKVVRGSRMARDGADATFRDIRHRAAGMVHEARGRMQPDEVDDETLIERVRARLGRVCSHPRAIDVMATDGDVTLSGPILGYEVENVLVTVGSVRGVRTVTNELEAHDTSAGVPSLQGRGRVAGPRLDILQSNWAPATRALVGLAAAAAAGGVAAAYRRH